MTFLAIKRWIEINLRRLVVYGIVKTAKDWRLPPIRSRKSINSTDSARCGGPDEKIPPAPRTNQIAGFVEFRPLTSWKKDNMSYPTCPVFLILPPVSYFQCLYLLSIVRSLRNPEKNKKKKQNKNVYMMYSLYWQTICDADLLVNIWSHL